MKRKYVISVVGVVILACLVSGMVGCAGGQGGGMSGERGIVDMMTKTPENASKDQNLVSGWADLNRRPPEPHIASRKGGGRLPPFREEL